MKALLLYPEFSGFGFWNYKDVCKLVGAKHPESPLGLITLAALFPENWDTKLIDLNTRILDDSHIDWADLVFIGGMLPQQTAFLRLIDKAHSLGKKVVAGGPDPTSRPHIYEKADYLVLGEAESSFQLFLEDLGKGVQTGEYKADSKPDLTESPTPRFELLDLRDYLMIGIQLSRGCPYNCEFCDIIELYGRKPRTKTPQQIVKELDTLYRLGYRGHVDLVEDNIVGYKEKAKEILVEMKVWSEKNGYPFFYSTEASINIADDDDLLGLLRDLDFRYVFIGIETADENVLKSVNKKQNTNRILIDDLHKIYRHGMLVNGGFIIGFDNETSESARSVIQIIEQGKICISMVGLLYALPNTQLERRLVKENRMIENFAKYREFDEYDVDQVTSGLNFVTNRSRSEIIDDFLYIQGKIYSPKNYFNRCLNVSKSIENDYKFKPSSKQILTFGKAFFKIVLKLGLKPATFFYFWRNILIILFSRISSLETVVNLMAMYIHFHKQTKFVMELMMKKKHKQQDYINSTKVEKETGNILVTD